MFAGCWLLPAVCWLWVVGRWLLCLVFFVVAMRTSMVYLCGVLYIVLIWCTGVVYDYGVFVWLLVVGCWVLDVGCCWLVFDCWLLACGCWLLAVGCWLLVVDR